MKKPGQIRIIGGQWKSRRVRCANLPGLRPSTDAVRETLFNWLPHALHHKSCLDLFAGSGAFGFEAASRGATKVIMVECSRPACNLLHINRQALRGEDTVEIFPMTVEKFLQKCHDNFDIIFMDPPFHDHVTRVIQTTCETLQHQGFFTPNALVYIESPYTDSPLPIPQNWHIIRQKRGSRVLSTLIQT